MILFEKLQTLSEKAAKLSEIVATEEATKQSLILPLFQILGYDVFNPLEFCPEFTADHGIKKGEKVDFAILNESGEPVIFIEAKTCTEKLEKHGSQLFRYFGTTTSAKIAILTNGLVYQFFTDLEETNKMDVIPFFQFDILNLKDSDIEYLKQFQKNNLDIDSIFDTASELKYTNLIKDFLSKQLENPDDDFVNYVAGIVYSGRKTQSVIETFRPILKKTFNQFIREIMSAKFKETLNSPEKDVATEKISDESINSDDNDTLIEKENKVITTLEELEGFAIIKSILRDKIDLNRVHHRDNESYFSILLDDNRRKWICRLQVESASKYLIVPTDDKKQNKIKIDSINDLFNHRDVLLSVIDRLEN